MDNSVMEWVYDRYYTSILAYAKNLTRGTGLDPDDLAVNTVYRFSDHYGDSDRNDNHAPLLFTIARNQFITELKGHRNRYDRHVDYACQFENVTSNGAEDLFIRADMDTIMDGNMPTGRMRRIFASHMDSYGEREIADREGLDISQVRTILGMSRKILMGSMDVLDFLKS